LGIDKRRQGVAVSISGVPSHQPTKKVLVTRKVRLGIGWGFGWCPSFDIQELGIKVAPTIEARDLRLQGWGFEPKGGVCVSEDRSIGISKIPTGRYACESARSV
jgi:hypothetical protein